MKDKGNKISVSLGGLMKEINVLSLFDGMACGRIALEKAGFIVKNYYASEIDNPAISVAIKNYPDIIQLGDITKIDESVLSALPKIDLVIGGSPCQDISGLNKKQNGLSGEKSGLFFHYRRIQKWIEKYNNPDVLFLLENVVGNKVAISRITEIMGVNPILINSSLVSAQQRNRYYWTNIPGITLPENKNIFLKDILETEISEQYYLSGGRLNWLLGASGQKATKKRYVSIDPEKAGCLTARSDASWNCNYVTRNGRLSKLTPVEYERLQTVPDNYTSCVKDSERYKMLGNGWTVDVVAHIFSFIPGTR